MPKKDKKNDDFDDFDDIDDVLGEHDEKFSPYIDQNDRVHREDDFDEDDDKDDLKSQKNRGKGGSRKTPHRLRFSSKQKQPQKRSFIAPENIEPTEQELDKVKNGLTEFYKNNMHFLKNGISIEKQIENVIETCKTGWTCAPKTFIKRVEWKTKWNSPGLKNRLDYKESYYNVKQVQIQKEIKAHKEDLYPGLSANDLRKVLQPEERKFWQEREVFYRQEFDFNNSSDWSLLLQILLEELTQFRLVKRRMKDEYDDVEFPLSESYKRLINAQKALGITREQREAASNETEGNIAQLSVIYEDKIKFLEKIQQRDKLEEEAMMVKHDNLDGLKLLPKDMADALMRGHETEITEVEVIDEPNNKKISDTDA